MMLFIVMAALLAIVLEKWLIGRDLEVIRGEQWPTARLAEPEAVLPVRIRVENHSRRLVPFLRVSVSFPRDLVPQSGVSGVTTDVWGNYGVSFSAWLRPWQRLERTVPVTIARRGRYVLRPMRLTSGDFLGLREQSKDCDQFAEIVVPPREANLERFQEMFGGFMGQVSVNRFILEDPVLTLGCREYTGREPMKMIAWKQSARSGGLMVKKYDYTLEPTVSVVLNVDTIHPDREALVETCLSMARSVCARLEKQGVKYDFTSNAVLAGDPMDQGSLGEGLGERHFNGVLEHLGRATSAHHLSASQLFEKEARRHGAAGRILITPGGELEDARGMNRLREASGGNLLILRAKEVAP